MNTIPPHAHKSNIPQTYTVYALAEPVRNITWQDVRYIGLSTNVQARFAQHLACRIADSNEDKSEWIQGLLRDGKLPLLKEIEKVATIEEGRAREQHWIRYAMAQGADILNRQITYTEQERIEIHARRAILYAKTAEILAQGTYVKRADGGRWYPPRLLDKYSVEQHFTLIDMMEIGFVVENDALVSVDDATDEQFNTFICRYISIHAPSSDVWSLEERRDVIEYAQSWGKELEFYQVPRPAKKRRAKKGK